MKPQDVILRMSDTSPLKPKGFESVRRTLEYVPFGHLPRDVIGEASTIAAKLAVDLDCEEVWLWIGPMRPGANIVLKNGGYEAPALEAEAVATCFQPIAV